MDLKQIEYIVKIAETGNITRAAEQLFVTQSALNQQLLKLENALGIKLFYRRKHDLTPTDAGKVYLKYGRQMLIEKREAYNIINDLAQDNLGHLSFTFSRERGLDMFVATYPAFHRQFPASSWNLTKCASITSSSDCPGLCGPGPCHAFGAAEIGRPPV